MTETGMILGNPYCGERRPGSVGLPFPGVEVKLVGRPDDPPSECTGKWADSSILQVLHKWACWSGAGRPSRLGYRQPGGPRRQVGKQMLL